MHKHEIVPCPRCQQPFECKMGTVTQCHCFSVVLNRDATEYIKSRFEDCLCHTCLLTTLMEYQHLQTHITGNRS